MKHVALFKTWPYCDTKKVTLFYQEPKAIEANVFSQEGVLEKIIPAKDINLPKEITADPNILFCYLQNTYIKLQERSDGSVGMTINFRLNGGGWVDGALSIVAIVGGGALIAFTGPVGAVIGSGLINAGINGGLEAWKNPDTDFSPDFLKQAGIGLTTGLVLGGAGQLAGALNISQATKVLETMGKAGKIVKPELVLLTGKVAINAAGGGVAQAIDSYMKEGEVDFGKVAMGTVAGGIIGAATGVLGNPHKEHVSKSLGKILEAPKESWGAAISEFAETVGMKFKAEAVEKAVASGADAVEKMVIGVLNHKEGVANAVLNDAFEQALRQMKTGRDVRNEAKAAANIARANATIERMAAEDQAKADQIAAQHAINRRLAQTNARLSAEQNQQRQQEAAASPTQNENHLFPPAEVGGIRRRTTTTTTTTTQGTSQRDGNDDDLPPPMTNMRRN